MVQRDRFLGLSLRTRWERRRLVVLYYAVLLLVLGLGLMPRGRHLAISMVVPLTFVVGSLLGGISYEGPVKPYARGMVNRDPDAGGLQTLGLDPATSRPVERLDERETGERDHAHFVAYRALILLGTLAGLLVFAGAKFCPGWLMVNAAMLCWLAFVVLLSMPQSVILWTEPDAMGEGEMGLVGSR